MVRVFVAYFYMLVFFFFFFIVLRVSEKLNWRVWRKDWSRETLRSYECGFEQIHKGREAFSLRFFLIAILFVIFDGEVVMLMPYIIGVLTNCGTVCKGFCWLFLVVLIVGLAHEKNEGRLEWAK